MAEHCKTDEDLEELDIQIGMIDDPQEIALTALRKHQEELGMTFEQPGAPVPAMPGYGPDEEFR